MNIPYPSRKVHSSVTQALASPAKSLVALPALLALASSASAVTLDIDSLAGMSNDPGALVPVANRLTNERQAQGVILTSTGGFVAVVAEDGTIGTGWKRNDPNVKAGLGGSSAAGELAYDGPITFTFVDSTNAATPFATDPSRYTPTGSATARR